MSPLGPRTRPGTRQQRRLNWFGPLPLYCAFLREDGRMWPVLAVAVEAVLLAGTNERPPAT
jgi:hypothetical protein